MTIEMQKVESSQINAIGYSAVNQTLVVEFKGGAKYQYSNIEPKTFEAMKSSESIGGFFYRNIKANKDKYPFSKIEPEIGAP